MEPCSYRLSSLNRDTVVLSDDEKDSPSRKHYHAKQTRKASIVSLHDDGKTKSRMNNTRLSLAPIGQEISDVLNFMRTCNLKANNANCLSTSDELPTVCENNSDEAELQFTEGMPDEEQISQHLLTNGAAASQKHENPEDDIDLTIKEKPSSLIEEEPKGMNIEDKLAQDHEFDIIGIMNLSSMNLTDNDMPMIIQRAFGEKRKKCLGLILRDNALTSEGVRILVDAVLKMRTNLKYLSFSNNADIGDAGIEHLIRLLQKNRSITFLAVPNTGMSDRGVRLLADTLCGVDPNSSCAPIEKLYISFNKSITDASIEAVLQILEQNQTLKVLSLQHCSLSDKARRRLRHVGTKMKKRKFSLAE